jgi:OOP family OmpA-OmpF porin
LPAGELYGLRAETEGNISENQNLDLRDIKFDQTIEKNFNLDPIGLAKVQENTSILLNNLFFDLEKATLRPESFPELNRIVTLMNENATMQIEIAGHTDTTGSDDYNLNLSKQRANSVASYLAGKGIDKSRMTVEFYGETKPMVSNETREGRKKNRRVEFKILKV